MADFAPEDGEENAFLSQRRRVSPFDDDSDDEFDEDDLQKRNCFQRCIPRRRNRELILGLFGGLVVVSLLLTAVILSLTTRANRPTVVILVSLDGFATSYLTAPGFEHPNLDKIAARGVKMETIPVFPSLTFPNHWSIVTGLWPESSGIIANRFFDPSVNRTFSYTNATEANDMRWWKGEPFWTTVQKAGMKSASFFWPGSEVEGLKPDYLLPYDGSVNNSDRVKKVVEWLDLDWTLRPSFITLYMSDVDSAGHKYGPTAPQTAAAVKAVDDALGELLLAIDNEGRQNRLLIDLLIVSDHGMTTISPNRTILLDRLINMTDVIIPDLGGPVASIWPIDLNRTESLIQSLQSEPGMLVMRKKDIPQDFHLRGNANVPPILGTKIVIWSEKNAM
eukprot:TRINITY_DN1746_c0_g1_i2.p1 TRINITY_DN1746_c0_g1~~TRINITY_DN1746_c0_g1_i2.p1  ORF type:complete len:413 (+),score=49.00 TRINITY_DN1746_c0_g1_i2:64-1239(+)